MDTDSNDDCKDNDAADHNYNDPGATIIIIIQLRLGHGIVVLLRLREVHSGCKACKTYRLLRHSSQHPIVSIATGTSYRAKAWVVVLQL